MNCFRRFCSCVTSFLPKLGFGSASASSSCCTCFADTPCGSSVMTTRHWPRASCSRSHLQRMSSEPRPVSYARRISSGGEISRPPPGKVRPGQALEHVLELRARMLDDVRRRGGDFLQVVRGDAGGEADRNAEASVQQPERQACRQQHRLLEFAVVVLLRNRRCPPRSRSAAVRQSGTAWLRCSDRPQPNRHHGYQSSPGRRSADSASRTAARGAPAPRRSRSRRADGICPAPRRRSARIWRSPAATRRVAHRVQDAPLHRLQAVGDLRQRARLDGRDRVAEVGLRGVLLDRRGIVAVVGGEKIGGSSVFGHLKRSSCLSAIAAASSTAFLAFSRSSATPARPPASQV